jgi:hypothetical protein
MPQWLSVSLGLVAGIAIIAGAIYIAVRPYVAAKPSKRIFPDQTGASHGYEPGTSVDGWVHGPDSSSGGDGTGH